MTLVTNIKYTEERILCPDCMRNNNFEFKVYMQDSKYYLATKCPKCNHHEDIKPISYRLAEPYINDSNKK